MTPPPAPPGPVRPRAGGAPAARLRRHPDFLRLWAGQTLSLVGSEVTLFALPLAAVALGAGPREMAWLAVARYLPTLLLGLPAGAWVDRLPRRPLLIATDLGRGAVLAAVPLAAVTGHLRLELLYPLAFLAAALAVLADVAQESYLPVLVGRERLVAGNSGLVLSQQAARVAGPSLGGVLVQAATAPLALLADAASFGVSAAPPGHHPRPRAGPPPAGRGTGAAPAGARDRPRGCASWSPTGCWARSRAPGGSTGFAFWLFWGQYPLYATRELGLTPAALGVIGSLAAGAGVLGAVVTTPLTTRFGAGGTMTGALLGAAAGTLLFAAAGGAPVVAGAVLALGLGLVLFCDPPYMVNYTSAFQALAPDGLRGRVGASIRVLTAGTAPVGAFLGGFLAESVGLRATAVMAGLGVVAAFLWLALSPVRSLRSLVGRVPRRLSGGPATGRAARRAGWGASPPRQPITGRV